jgi:small-conductance mechanosensitive channel
VLFRISIVVAALIFAAPVVTGNADGALGRTGAIVLVALGLAATPLFACGLTGAIMLFGRRLAVGEYVQIRGQLGRITSINLLDLRLSTADGTEQRIPHLLLLACAIEQMGTAPRLSVDLVVPSDVAPARVLELLVSAADRRAHDSKAELVSMDTAGLRYRVTATLITPAGRSSLLQALIEGLGDAGIGLAKGAAPSRHD